MLYIQHIFLKPMPRPKQEYEELKKLCRSGMSVGFLIREAIHEFLKKTKEK